MIRRSSPRRARCCAAALAAAVTLPFLGACSSEPTGPSNGPAARLEAASDAVRSGVVGSALAAPVVVKVLDAGSRVVLGATVTFTVTQGDGSISPRTVPSDSSGLATATWTLGTAVATSEVTVSVTGVSAPVKFTATAAAGPAVALNVAPRNARILN